MAGKDRKRIRIIVWQSVNDDFILFHDRSKVKQCKSESIAWKKNWFAQTERERDGV